MTNFKRYVIEFNEKRATIRTFSFAIENKMLDEEWREFLTAKKLSEVLDAVCDFMYVFTGSKIKYLTSGRGISKDAIDQFFEYNKMRIDFMDETLRELNIPIPIIDRALDIVCKCNEKKSTRIDENGKVVKGDIPDATQLIEEMLIEKGFMEGEKNV